MHRHVKNEQISTTIRRDEPNSKSIPPSLAMPTGNEVADRFITLKCPSCAGNLDIAEDMDSFACGFCGTKQVVQRRGGTVSLKPIGEAIARVQVGTDRTAAELAIRRLREDLAALEQEWEDYEDRAIEYERHTQGYGLIAFFLTVGFFAILILAALGYVFVTVVVLLGIVGFGVMMIKRVRRDAGRRRERYVAARRRFRKCRDDIEAEIEGFLEVLNRRSI